MDVAGDGDVAGQGDRDEHDPAAAQSPEDFDVAVVGGGVEGEAGQLEELGGLVGLVVGADHAEQGAGVAAVGGAVGVDLDDPVRVSAVSGARRAVQSSRAVARASA